MMKLAIKATMDDKDLQQSVDRVVKRFKDLDAGVNKSSNNTNVLSADFKKLGTDGKRSVVSVVRELKNIQSQQQKNTAATTNQTRLLKANMLNTGRTGKRAYQEIKAEVIQLRQETAKLQAIQTQANTRMKSGGTAVAGSIGRITAMLGPLAAGISVAFAVGGAIRFADQMKNLENQLRLTVSSEEELVSVRKALLDVSNDSRSDFQATAQLYARMHRATRDLDVSQGDLVNVTETITKSFAVSGATVQETEGAVRQLSQALASGVFRGEEFNSVAEQGPRLMQILQDEYGKTAGELRAMAMQGELTAEIVLTAIKNQGATVAEEFAKMPPTMSQATTAGMNSLKFLIGSLDSTSDASGTVAEMIVGISKSISDLGASIESGQIGVVLDGYKAEFINNFSGIAEAGGELTEFIEKVGVFIADTFNSYSDYILDFAKNAPAYVKYAIDRMGVEFSAMKDLVPLYITAFINQAKAELTEFANDLGAIGSEILDQLNIFDGNSFDLETAFKKNAEQAKAHTESLNQEVTAQINEAKRGREGAIAELDKQLEQGKARLKQVRENGAAALGQYNAGTKSVKDSATGNSETLKIGGSKSTSSSDLEALRESLMSEEALRSEYLQRRVAMINNAVETEQLSEAKGAELIQQSVQKHLQETHAAQLQRNNLILTSSQQLFGGLAGLAKTFGGEQSKAYKLMFAVQKGFAVAQGIMNLTTAISQASILPFPANIPAMATAASTGASLVATIKSASYQGQAHDGLSRVPSSNEGTYMLRKDEMVMNPKQRENFEGMRKDYAQNKASGGGKVINYTMSPIINIEAGAGVNKAEIKSLVDTSLAEYDQSFQEDLASNGPRAQLLAGRAA